LAFHKGIGAGSDSGGYPNHVFGAFPVIDNFNDLYDNENKRGACADIAYPEQLFKHFVKPLGIILSIYLAMNQAVVTAVFFRR
jgi:hypothetical protein